MNASRMKNRTHWYGVGRRAAMLGIPYGNVETCSNQTNMWISEGYASVRADAEAMDKKRAAAKRRAARKPKER